MKKLVTFIVLALLLTFWATPVYAAALPPALPHAFYGSVMINGNPAASDTRVSAKVSEGVIIATQNPVATVGGSYGIDSPKLLVQGNIPNGATITLHVTNANGTAIGGTAIFEAGGGPTLANLSVNITAPAPAPPTVETDLFGVRGSLPISSTGIIQETLKATSADGKLQITIPKLTKALDKYGDPLYTLVAAVKTSPPDPPEKAHIIGLAYDFGPSGATFDPPITLIRSYDPAALPEGVAEEDLVIAYYDAAAGKWVELDCVVDTEKNTITALVSHFTTFAIIGSVTPLLPVPAAAFSLSNLSVKPAEVVIGEEVTITVSVANTGATKGSYTVVLKINGVKEAEKTATIAAGSSLDVSFSVTKEEVGDYTVGVDGLSGSFTVVAVPAPAAFSLSNLSIKPLQIQLKEVVTITVSVANTGGTEGSYTVMLEINGVAEEGKTVTIAAGSSQNVAFFVTREEVGDYTVGVDGLSGSFSVVALPSGVNWPLIGGIIAAAVIAVAFITFWLRRKLKT